jgi:hypothetical protein
MRDSQRSKLYKAERAAWACYDTQPYLTLDECKKLIHKCAKFSHGPRPTVTDGRGTRFARGSSWRINLPKWARTAPVVLHEYAHALTSHMTVAAHGPEFAAAFVKLTRRFIGKTEGDILKMAFRQYRVKCQARKKMVTTPFGKWGMV